MSGAACSKMIDCLVTNSCLEKFVIQMIGLQFENINIDLILPFGFYLFKKNILWPHKSLARLENYFIDMLFIT